MNTVTYGTKCAPFLAIRCLKQLAKDEKLKYPLASEVALSDIYMDDIVTGASDLESAVKLQEQLTNMFDSCCMKLHKWNSNSKHLMNSSCSTEELYFDTTEATKTLGIIWLPEPDKVCLTERSTFTKREVLLVIATLYDPIGYLGPVISKAKILLQQLWLHKLKWDDQLPEPFASEWFKFVSGLKNLENIKIERYLLNSLEDTISIVGFADASTSAYGGVVYLHPCPSSPTLKLLASKSRVAPLKTITVPRLELCACLLLVNLVQKVINSLKLDIFKVILFSDSTIALAWIHSPAHQLKTFVGNRVSKIQSLSENFEWRHISSEKNPADLISRGVGPKELQFLDLWFYGPPNLSFDSSESNSSGILDHELYESEEKKSPKIALTLTSQADFVNYILNLSNNFAKLIHIFSYIFRFITACRKKQMILGPFTKEEFERSKLCLVKLA